MKLKVDIRREAFDFVAYNNSPAFERQFEDNNGVVAKADNLTDLFEKLSAHADVENVVVEVTMNLLGLALDRIK